MSQLQLFETPPEVSIGRSENYRKAVFDLMKDGQWRTKYAIQQKLGGDSSSAASRLRDFRMDRWGGHTVNIRKVSAGVFQYQLILKK